MTAMEMFLVALLSVAAGWVLRDMYQMSKEER